MSRLFHKFEKGTLSAKDTAYYDDHYVGGYVKNTNTGKVVLYITEGSIDFTIAGVIHHLKTGDRMDVPPQTPHSAVVGDEGVQFVVGEEIEGDS